MNSTSSLRVLVLEDAAAIRAPGSTPKRHAALFQLFSRVTSTRVKGHGLGLSTVRSIIEKLGGSVDVEGQRGAGSRFLFELPAAS